MLTGGLVFYFFLLSSFLAIILGLVASWLWLLSWVGDILVIRVFDVSLPLGGESLWLGLLSGVGVNLLSWHMCLILMAQGWLWLGIDTWRCLMMFLPRVEDYVSGSSTRTHNWVPKMTCHSPASSKPTSTMWHEWPVQMEVLEWIKCWGWFLRPPPELLWLFIAIC